MSIAIKGLTKSYGETQVIHSVSLEVGVGEFVSLLGPSGCGKTTILRCIAGLEESTAGVIAIGDEVVSEPERGVLVPSHNREIGMVFQSYAVWPHLNVAKNVGFPLSVRGIPASSLQQQVEEALALVGLTGLGARYPSQLSGGQQQRVALARAIIGKPKILLFDEPLSNLDAKLREVTRAEIRRLQRRLNVAALYVTHDQEEALSMSDRVIVMNEGRIMQVGTPTELYHQPRNRFVADFVGKASFMDIRPTGEPNRWILSDGSPIQVIDDHVKSTDRCQLMIRPEAAEVFISDSATKTPRDVTDEVKGNEVRGVVQERSFVGPFTEYVVSIGKEKVRVNARNNIPEGTQVSVFFSREHCRLVAVNE